MVRTRLISSGLNTGGSFCGSFMCQISAARSWRRSVTRNRKRTPVMIRLRLQMLAPLLDEVQLEAAHLVGRRRIGRTFEPGGEPLAAIDVAALRVRVELARSHVFDHTLTQRTDSVGLAHRALLPELRLNDPQFSGRGCPSRHRYPIGLLPALPAHAPRASGPERSDFVPLRTPAVPGGGFERSQFAMFWRRLDQCLLRADLCRSRATLEGSCPAQTCRPRRLKMTAGSRGSLPQKPLIVWTTTNAPSPHTHAERGKRRRASWMGQPRPTRSSRLLRHLTSICQSSRAAFSVQREVVPICAGRIFAAWS